MSENYITKQDGNGSVHISEEVVATIVRSAMSEIEGCQSISNPTAVDLADKVGIRLSRGVRLKMEESGIIVDTAINVNYGFNIIDVAEKVQQNILSALQSMTGIDDVQVNVHVAGIAF